MTDSGTVVGEWVSETTASERVEAVVMGVQGPRPVSWLAQVAVAATVTTQDVIDELSSDGVVKVIGEADGEQVVRPDREHVREITEREVREAFEDETELRKLRNELQYTACGENNPIGASKYRLDVVRSVIQEHREDE